MPHYSPRYWKPPFEPSCAFTNTLRVVSNLITFTRPPTHQFFGIFSSETHVLAPGSVAAPQTDPGIDAVTNPATAPVHMYHLGMWFSDPADAAAAGCPGTSTPFDGDHVAGIQVLNTRNFPNLEGPLLQLE